MRDARLKESTRIKPFPDAAIAAGADYPRPNAEKRVWSHEIAARFTRPRRASEDHGRSHKITRSFAGSRVVSQNHGSLHRIMRRFTGSRPASQDYASLHRITARFTGLRVASEDHGSLRRITGRFTGSRRASIRYASGPLARHAGRGLEAVSEPDSSGTGILACGRRSRRKRAEYRSPQAGMPVPPGFETASETAGCHGFGTP